MATNEWRTRDSAIDAMIPLPPADMAPMRTAFAGMVARQWQTYVPRVIRGSEAGIAGSKFAKGRFVGEMYARACYSMLLISKKGPVSLRLPVRAGALSPHSRKMTIRLGSALLRSMERLLPRAVHRQLILTSALMGMFDQVLDDATSLGEAAALRTASLIAKPSPPKLRPEEEAIALLASAARQGETRWQAEYWVRVLQPAVRSYCLAEARAVKQEPDPARMGHRGEGIEASIRGMWYAAGPRIGLQSDSAGFEKSNWNREQQWMADTSLLMQMIDDWLDQEEDRRSRLTAVVSGDWTLESAAELFDKTTQDLDSLLRASRIRNPVAKAIFTDLYKDYLRTAIDAMRTGVAA